jgi:lipopolysaccharide assembly protein A
MTNREIACRPSAMGIQKNERKCLVKIDAVMPKIKLVALLTLLLVALLLILQNTQTVATNLLFVTVSMPLAALLALTLLIGLAAGVLVALKVGKRVA